MRYGQALRKASERRWNEQDYADGIEGHLHLHSFYTTSLGTSVTLIGILEQSTGAITC